MSKRRIPIVSGEIYHLFNRSVARQPIFNSFKDYSRALETINYYTYSNPAIRFSYFNRLPDNQKEEFFLRLQQTDKQVVLFAYALMPNHFHILAKGLTEKGVIKFLTNFQNSYARYFNTKNTRNGSLFQIQFKAVRIETDEQFVHVVRYIHLNPLTSYVIKEFKELENYPWTSYHEYLNQNPKIVNTEEALAYFLNVESFKSFTADQVDYQRKLDEIKHLINE